MFEGEVKEAGGMPQGPYGSPPGGGFGGPPGGAFGGPGFGSPGGFGAPPPGAYPPPGYPFRPPLPQTEPVGVAATVTGVVGIATSACCSFIGIPFAIAAIVLGIISLVRIRNSPSRYTGKVWAWIGIAIGLGGILVLFLTLLFGFGPAIFEEISRNL